ncbi:MAG: penicillin-binding protein 2 [Gammaproteobacteria bacterium]|nr:penicillin-binding protein 2 [Gammaproteobacteria bacterium]MDH3405389.1 penicillin-binding protein 2 [Gammaproteobacteria bacterium]MDH3562667.1 penicillin-binding protein 2 [Gammaproteobacteria bacterium]MDH5486487.1 penicillin-binding protein 2 [Gammaproteobacteria bacterium]
MLNIPIKDHFRETRLYNARLTVVAAVVLVLILALFLRLAYLQVVSHRHFETLSQANRVKPLPIPPPRGLILDRHGFILAQNYPVYTLEIIPEQVDDMATLLEELKQVVSLNEADLRNFRKQMRERPRFENLLLRSHLTQEEAARVAVRRTYFSGVELEARLQRHYPLAGLGVHFLGYVARINEQELERIDKATYRGMQHIGKLGVELSYEKVLLGQVGFEKVETNAHGRSLRILERIAPVAGKNLQLNIDAKLQSLAEQALGKRRGAVIAMDPSTGGVLAFVSTPTYDPNPFVNGIAPDSYQALLNDPDKPLINRALNGQYAPGSTIKAFLGLAALEAGDFDASHPVTCPGWFTLPGSSHQFRDWKKGGHGIVDLHDAVVQSCDVYFYKLAVAMGVDAMKQFLAAFGFSQKTGVDLLNESEGLLPSVEWKEARGQKWYPGETVVTGIGQGPILVTPLQLAAATASLANQGVRPKPRLVHAIVDAKTGVAREPPTESFPPIALKNNQHLDIMIQNLTDVVHTNKGTAYGIGYNAPYKIAGKTGTAQVKSIAQGQAYSEKLTPERFRDHALFVSFAPVGSPKVAVAVIVENGGHGSSAAAPIARKVMDHVILGKASTIPGVARPVIENEE